MQSKRPPYKTCFVAFVASSVDGRISLAKKTAPRWTSKEDWRLFQQALLRVDAVVVGRNTYAAASHRLRWRNTFVLSNRSKKLIRRGSVKFVNPTTNNLTKLFAEYKRVAVLGGGSVYGFMLKKGLLDEIFVTIEPFIFGRGKEMFTGCFKTTPVRLLSVRRLNSTGTILLHYAIKRKKL